jgi:hypothetical protein
MNSRNLPTLREDHRKILREIRDHERKCQTYATTITTTNSVLSRYAAISALQISLAVLEDLHSMLNRINLLIDLHTKKYNKSIKKTRH